MRLLFVIAGLVLAFGSFTTAVEEIQRRNVLTIKQEQSDVGGRQNVPQLNLSTVVVNSRDVCVRARLRMKPLLGNKILQLNFTDLTKSKSRTVLMWKGHGNNTFQWQWQSVNRSRRVHTDPFCFLSKEHSDVLKTTTWLLQFDCFKAHPGHTVHVSVHDNRSLVTASYVVEHLPSEDDKDPVPRYNVTVKTSAKLFVVALDRGQKVEARLCYKNLHPACDGIRSQESLQINSDLNSTVNLSFPHLVPCVCVQLYYTGVDTRRDLTCPFKDRLLQDGGDILSSSSVKLFGSSTLEWIPLCPSDSSKPTVSLCWQHHSQCFPIQNSTLEDRDLKYSVTAVDKHALMCVKFALNGSHRVFCPFSSGDFSEWDLTVIPGSQRLHVKVSSSIPASFSAQLCVEERGEYVTKGNAHTVQMKEGAREVELSLPLPFFIPGICVQVWRSEPALKGSRIICPNYTHRRWGLVFAVSLALLITVVTLGFVIYMILIKKKTSVWRCAERKPVLLVCSSDDAAHVAAVCALASGLLEELRIDVRLAQWAHCSTQASLADLGPAPWLHGQCQEVQRAGGVVLLAWSLEAQQTFLQWREREGMEERKGQLWKGTTEKKDIAWCDAQLNAQENKKKDGWKSSVTAPVLTATLSSLWAGLHSESCGQGFGLVYFRGLGKSCHIPKDLQGIRRYCLPRDLSSLIHELDLWERRPGSGVKKVSGGLFSKALSFWLSQRLAQRLEAWLPQKDSQQDREKSKLIQKRSKQHTVKKMKKGKKNRKALSLFKPKKKNMIFNTVTESG